MFISIIVTIIITIIITIVSANHRSLLSYWQ